ncbi:MAG: hypothetical protein ACJATP_000313, partial [Candidatus Azotimanducaceae bacterium]
MNILIAESSMGNLPLSRLCRLCQNVMLVLQGGARLVKNVQPIRAAERAHSRLLVEQKWRPLCKPVLFLALQVSIEITE